MTDQNIILILVIAFFLLGCSFSCNGMKENFTNIETECRKICEENNGTKLNCVTSCFTCANKYSNEAEAEGCLTCKENIDKKPENYYDSHWRKDQLARINEKKNC